VPRPVSVYNLDLCSKYNNKLLKLPEFALSIECSGGLYVRTLIVDLARSLGGRAHMTALLRTKQGIYTLDDCLPQENWDFESICKGIVDCTQKREDVQAFNHQ
jgi:tRNA pseudouridine55 synthase